MPLARQSTVPATHVQQETNCAPCSPSSSAKHALTLKPQQSFRAKPEPAPANLSATLRVADIAVSAPAATLRYVASVKGAPHMLSRKLTRFIVAGAAAVAVAGGSYGMVSAASSSGSAAASSSPAASSSGFA